jgi:hypothetical protein
MQKNVFDDILRAISGVAEAHVEVAVRNWQNLKEQPKEKRWKILMGMALCCHQTNEIGQMSRLILEGILRADGEMDHVEDGIRLAGEDAIETIKKTMKEVLDDDSSS